MNLSRIGHAFQPARLQRSQQLGACAIFVFLGLVANLWRNVVLFHVNNPRIDDLGTRMSAETHFSYPQPLGRNQRKTDVQNTQYHNPNFVVVNEVIHRADFGLGHRLHRSAASYHLAHSLSLPMKNISGNEQQQPPITHLRFDWKSCLAKDDNANVTISNVEAETKEYIVFRYLFGDDVWILSDPPKQSLTGTDKNLRFGNSGVGSGVLIPDRRNMVVVRNDVEGYIAGQVYKNLRLPIKWDPKTVLSDANNQSPLPTLTVSRDQAIGYNEILDKVMRSDVNFYRRLADSYRFNVELEEFQVRHKWNERPLVIGLHLRAGNGEKGHFADSGRGEGENEAVMVTRLVQLINMVATREMKRRGKGKGASLQQNEDQQDGLRPLLFIATDTSHLLPLVNKAAQEIGSSMHNTTTTTQPKIAPFEIITWPQYRLPKNAGVSFQTLDGKGDSCLEGWKSAMSDALMLSKVDVLVAARRSTFTQSLPLSLGFGRSRKRGGNLFLFCEVSESDTTSITCFTNARLWLFREQDHLKSGSTDKDSGNDKDSNDLESWTLHIPTIASGGSDTRQRIEKQVEHKLTVLLPDVTHSPFFWYARKQIQNKSVYDPNPLQSDRKTEEYVIYYGRKFFTKYQDRSGEKRGFIKSEK